MRQADQDGSKYRDAVGARKLSELLLMTRALYKFSCFLQFKTVMSQGGSGRQLLPIPRRAIAETGGATARKPKHIYRTTGGGNFFGRLLPKQVETNLYRAMLPGRSLSEQGARMTTMDSHRNGRID